MLSLNHRRVGEKAIPVKEPEMYHPCDNSHMLSDRFCHPWMWASLFFHSKRFTQSLHSVIGAGNTVVNKTDKSEIFLSLLLKGGDSYGKRSVTAKIVVPQNLCYCSSQGV